MAAVIQSTRQFAYDVARLMARGEGALEASMVKAYVCRAAEWVTREAMQIHGGMGYAEEYPVSRYFVDARVLSIFEGADETLCLKVIARRLVERAAQKRPKSRGLEPGALATCPRTSWPSCGSPRRSSRHRTSPSPCARPRSLDSVRLQDVVGAVELLLGGRETARSR